MGNNKFDMLRCNSRHLKLLLPPLTRPGTWMDSIATMIFRLNNVFGYRAVMDDIKSII